MRFRAYKPMFSRRKKVAESHILEESWLQKFLIVLGQLNLPTLNSSKSPFASCSIGLTVQHLAKVASAVPQFGQPNKMNIIF